MDAYFCASNNTEDNALFSILLFITVDTAICQHFLFYYF